MRRFSIVLLLSAFAGVFLLGLLSGRFLSSDKNGASGTPERRVLYYVDPMNPSHTSDQPGLAPCGMKLEPVYADEDGGDGQPPPTFSPGAVRIGAERQQMIGVRVDTVQVAADERTVRALGRVAADENRISRLLAGRDGYMGNVEAAVPTGSYVKENQLLAAYFAIDSLAAQQSYIYALNAMARGTQDLTPLQQLAGGTASLLLNAEENLKLYGMGEAQVREIAKSRQVSNYIELRAPFSGYVLSRNVFPFSLFQRDTEFFRVVDLREVWVYADVFDDDRELMKPGGTARVYVPGTTRAFEGKVSEALPLYDSNSRAYRLRVDVANPDAVLRPDAFVDVEFSVPLPPSLSVPVDAVIDTGRRKTVFVALRDGFFEPRTVTTGWRSGDRVQILDGLKAGERVVVAGNFLIDSESRMKLASAGFHGALEKDPVCGMDIDSGKASEEGLTLQSGGKSLYFCSKECLEQYKEAHPNGTGPSVEKSKSAPAAGQTMVPHQHSSMENMNGTGSEEEDTDSEEEAEEPAPGSMMPENQSGASKGSSEPGTYAKDPVCNMMVSSGKAGARGLKSSVDGKSYYFCSRECKTRFDEDPSHWIGKQGRGGSPGAPMPPMQMGPGEMNPGSPMLQTPANPGTRGAGGTVLNTPMPPGGQGTPGSSMPQMPMSPGNKGTGGTMPNMPMPAGGKSTGNSMPQMPANPGSKGGS